MTTDRKIFAVWGSIMAALGLVGFAVAPPGRFLYFTIIMMGFVVIVRELTRRRGE